MTERARWVWLVTTIVMGIGILTGTGILYTNNVEREGREENIRIERDAQRDLCELLAVFDDPSAPPASTPRGVVQQNAVRAYRLKRC